MDAAEDLILKPAKTPVHWYSVWQLALSLVGILLLWGLTLPTVFLGLSALLNGNLTDAVSNLMMAGGWGFAGLLLLPSAGLALMRLIGRPVKRLWSPPVPLWVLALSVPLVVLLGHLVSGVPGLAWLLLPILHILMVLLPTLWLVARGARGLDLGSPQRIWGTLAAGLVLAPLLSLIFELLLGLVLLIVFSLYLTQDAGLMAELVALSDQLLGPVQDPQLIYELLEPYLLKPEVLGLGLFYGALAVPLIEELFKPIGVWLLCGRKLTPAQGFGLGLVSGAGYAIFENITLASGIVDGWAAVMVARMGTSLLHILTTGLTGWALASSWQDRRYLRLALTYLISVSIHGLWNGTVLTQSIVELLPAESTPAVLQSASPVMALVIGLLTLGCLTLLLVLNSRLSRAIIPPASLPSVVSLDPEVAEIQTEEDSDNGTDNLLD